MIRTLVEAVAKNTAIIDLSAILYKTLTEYEGSGNVLTKNITDMAEPYILNTVLKRVAIETPMDILNILRVNRLNLSNDDIYINDKILSIIHEKEKNSLINISFLNEKLVNNLYNYTPSDHTPLNNDDTLVSIFTVMEASCDLINVLPKLVVRLGFTGTALYVMYLYKLQDK